MNEQQRNNENTPSMGDAERCIDYRKRGKRGEHLSLEEMNFCGEMFLKYPEWYTSIKAEYLEK